MKAKKENKADIIIDRVSARLLDDMKKYGSDWTKSWTGANSPINHVTTKNYTGINMPNLTYTMLDNDYKHNVWGTYKQWESKGYKVEKGQKSHTAVVYSETKVYPKRDGSLKENGEPETIRIYFNKCTPVFNIAQTDCPTKEYEANKPKQVFDLEAVEQFVKNTKAVIKAGGDKAFYSPKLDYVCMPDKDSFIKTESASATENYYATLLHELTHWTSHKERCNRKLGMTFGNDQYAYEELIAESGSAMLCGLLGVSNEPRADHAKYLNCWIKHLEEKPSKMKSALGQASKAVQFLTNLQEMARVKKVA